LAGRGKNGSFNNRHNNYKKEKKIKTKNYFLIISSLPKATVTLILEI
jgi:hypothetical protein